MRADEIVAIVLDQPGVGVRALEPPQRREGRPGRAAPRGVFHAARRSQNNSTSGVGAGKRTTFIGVT
jgi:hypothetical protein